VVLVTSNIETATKRLVQATRNTAMATKIVIQATNNVTTTTNSKTSKNQFEVFYFSIILGLQLYAENQGILG